MADEELGGKEMEYVQQTVSIIVPFVTRDSQLERAIESCLQIERLHEVILVNDGDSLMTSNPRSKIREIRNTRTRGGLGARISGIEESETDLVVFLDSDDELQPEGIRKAIDLMTIQPDVGIAYGDILAGDKVVKMQRVCGNAFRLVLRNLSLAPFSGAVFRVSSASLCKLNLELLAWQDDAFFLEVSRQTNVCHVGMPVARFHFDRPVRISTQTARRIQGLTLLLRDYRKEIIRTFSLFRMLLWLLRLWSLKLEEFASVSDSRLKKSFATSLRRKIRALLKPHFDYMYA